MSKHELDSSVHKKRSFFSRLLRFAKSHPVTTSLIAISGVLGVAAMATGIGGISIAAGSLALGITSTAIGIAADSSKLTGESVRRFESQKKKIEQTKVGNPGGKFVQDYIIVSGIRYGESKTKDRTITRFNYVKAKETLEKKLAAEKNPAEQEKLKAKILDLNIKMTEYENEFMKGKKKVSSESTMMLINQILHSPSTPAIADALGGRSILLSSRSANPEPIAVITASAPSSPTEKPKIEEDQTLRPDAKLESNDSSNAPRLS